MTRHLCRCTIAILCAAALLVARAGAGLAGDGGTVTVERILAATAPGQPTSIHFIVYTHGQPIDYFGKEPIRPYLTATNRATKETLRAEGYKDGAVGHFAVAITLPDAGPWELRIKAEPLMVGVWQGALVVGPKASQPANGRGEALGQGIANGATAAGSALAAMLRR